MRSYEIICIILNYNAKEWVLNCIDSVVKQEYTDKDILVIDNASTDGSVSAIRDIYGDSIFVIENKENLGGSGGFDTGLEYAIGLKYKYIVLIDNDAMIEPTVIGTMKSYLDKNEDVGQVGTRIMVMDHPDRVQEAGSFIDFNNYYYRLRMDKNIPPDCKDSALECDYVPACATMIRAEALKGKTNNMPRENFIYWDDFELSYKIKSRGFKIVCLLNIVTHHRGGYKKATNTFSRYYFLRNRLNFFAKYIPEDDIERFVDVTLSDLFPKFYGYYYKGFTEYLRTEFYAFNDFVNLIRGKADEHKILNLTEHEIPFEKLIKDKKRINIKLDGISDSKDYMSALYNVIARIANKAPQEKIWLSAAAGENDASFYIEKINEIYSERNATYDLPEFVISSEKNENFDLNIVPCDHVKNVKENILPDVYADKYLNCITNDEDYRFFTSMDMNEKIFRWMYRPMMIEAVHKIRKKAEEND